MSLDIIVRVHLIAETNLLRYIYTPIKLRLMFLTV